VARGEPYGLLINRRCGVRITPREEPFMHRQSAEEFLLTLLETLDDLPPDFATRFAEVVANEGVDRSQAIRQLFEDVAGE
jgi:hypothetical protein